MDAIGLVMGMLTIPMALLTVAGMAAGVELIGAGEWRLVAGGLVWAGLCWLLARPLERVVIAIDDRAAVSLARGRRARARGFAALSGALPMLVIIAAEIAAVRWGVVRGQGAMTVLSWLWSYAVATGPWTLFAARVSRFRRTLASIRAYAGHLALWLFAALSLAGVSPAVAAAAALLPALLPFAVGVLLALADRDAIANVRI